MTTPWSSKRAGGSSTGGPCATTSDVRRAPEPFGARSHLAGRSAWAGPPQASRRPTRSRWPRNRCAGPPSVRALDRFAAGPGHSIAERCSLEDSMNLGPLEIGLILVAVLLLFGYKKLPDASRSLGRSLRIF